MTRGDWFLLLLLAGLYAATIGFAVWKVMQ